MVISDNQMTLSEAVQSCSVKKVFLEISLNSQESTYVRVSFFLKKVSYRTPPMAASIL